MEPLIVKRSGFTVAGIVGNGASVNDKAAHAFDIQVYDDRFKSPSDPESVIDILIPVVLK